MKQYLIYLILALAICTEAGAQSPWFQQYSIGELHPNARAELVYQDRNSLLWFGTTRGLFMFDGLTFTPYLKQDSTASNHVRAIFQDRNGRLWTGYEDGSIFYLSNQRLRKWEPEEGTPAAAVTGFAEDAAGRFWFSTYGEGVYYQEGGHVYNFDRTDGLLGNDIYVMTPDKWGRMWLGTDGGISICQVSKGEKQVKNLTRADGLSDDIVREILAGPDGNMWIGTYDRGICVYNIDAGRFSYPVDNWQYGIVNQLELFEDQELWIGTEGQGVWRYSFRDRQLHHLDIQKNIKGAKVYDLKKDYEGNIWLLTNTLGITSANRQFELMTIPFESTQAILVSSTGDIWTGQRSGLYKLNSSESGEHNFKQVLKNLDLNVVSLYEDKYGNIWIGTFDKGVYCFNPGSGKVRHLTEKDGLSNNNVLSIDGVNGHIWLATLGGVTEIEYHSDIISGRKPLMRNYNQSNGLGTNFIYKVFIDSKGRTWFGTDGKGISVLDNGIIRNYSTNLPAGKVSHPESHEIKAVYSITEDHQGHIWLSTARQGIFEFDGEHFNHLTVKEGIRDLAITGLATAANGQVVIVNTSGIDLLTPKTHHLIYYDEAIGISSIQPNLNAICKDKWGNVWIAIRNGIIKYTSLSEKLEIHPRTLLTGVSVFLEPVDFDSVNQFSHNQNNLIFEYVGLWYTNPEAVKYRYKLSGYDLNWIESKDRRVTYSNLPPGEYTFHVVSTENDTWLDEPVISWQFEILPPLWMRWWFVALCILLTGGLFYWYLKTRDMRLQRVHLLEKDKAESELAAIKAQINPHFLFNSFNTLISVIEEDPEVAVEYVEKLSDFYRSMMQLRDKEVISLQEELELVMHYGYLLKKRYGENFQLNVELNGRAVAYVVPLSLQILVENAVKHNVISSSRPLTVDISMDVPDYVSVANNLQPKVQPEKSTRFGLQSLTRRYEFLSGRKVKVEATKSHFKVSVPVIE